MVNIAFQQLRCFNSLVHNDLSIVKYAYQPQPLLFLAMNEKYWPNLSAFPKNTNKQITKILNLV